MKTLSIAYIAETLPNDRHAWSGTAHYVYKALQHEGFEVTHLGPARPLMLRLVLGLANKFSLLLFGKRFDYRHSRLYSKAFGRIFGKKLKNTVHDLVLVCGGTEYGAWLKTDKPVYYVLDRTIGGAVNYHTILSGLWEFSKKQSISTDKRAMHGAHKLIFSSEWAAQHAQDIYGIPAAKTAVIPFGANLDKLPDRTQALENKPAGECRLLLIGTYWKNKGADIAYNTLLLLLKNNIKAKLTVVGCTPPDNLQHECLRVIPFVDKNTPEGIDTLWQLFKDHHFFILPTRFDCTPIVYCEASAFGVPVLSADTGGVRGHVSEGVNGFLFPYNDMGEAYAAKIMQLMANPGEYAALRASTRTYYEENLNWETWSARFRKLLEPLLSEPVRG